jgi:hypothetical protein
MLAFDNMEERGIKGTAPWASYQVVLDVPNDAREVAFGVLLAGVGAISISDVKLTTVDSSVAVTSKEKPNKPINLELAQ